MTIKSCKVFPISITQAAKCCVCYQFKKEYKVCTNQKCSDGIICYDCLDKMDSSQKEMCQICRTKMDVFKTNVQFQPIQIHIKNDYISSDYNDNGNSQIVLLRSKKTKCCLCEIVKIILAVISILLFSYIIGLLIVCGLLSLNIEFEIRTMNPFLYIFIGACILGSITFCCCRIVAVNKNHK